ncbi:MAG: hypothetical protein WC718_15570 [Phycisphaerales bacterium]|jgi:Sec-independent protein secretion pathway component TatC/predicted RNA-binding Zn-ribbon protein involved in translation (DUF1610 family)
MLAVVNCRTCDYPLWEIRDRTCPECGSGFVPSDFRFPRGGVKFSCPHCGQAYYGTDENGQLEPREFVCVTCGTRIGIDETVVSLHRGGSSAEIRIPPKFSNPWLERHRLGWYRAIMQTATAGMTEPDAMMRATSPHDTTALAFVMVLFAFTALVAALPWVAWGVWGFVTARLFGTDIVELALWLVVPPLVAALLGLCLVLTVGTIAHVILILTGPNPYGLRRTLQACAYTSGPMMLCIVPCLGVVWVPVGLLWWYLCACGALTVAQEVSIWRGVSAITLAIVIVATPLVLWMATQ